MRQVKEIQSKFYRKISIRIIQLFLYRAFRQIEDEFLSRVSVLQSGEDMGYGYGFFCR